MKPIPNLVRTNLTIPIDTKEWLKQVGGGQMSRGIRILHRMHQKIDYPVGRPRKSAA